jgi:hypothetical protein
MCNTVTLDPGVICPAPNKDVVGRVMKYPGQTLSGAGTPITSETFLIVTRLVH